MVGVISAVLGGAVLLLSYFVAYQSTSWFVVAHAVLGNAVLLLAFFFLHRDVREARSVTRDSTLTYSDRSGDACPRVREPKTFTGCANDFKEWTFAVELGLRANRIVKEDHEVDYATSYLGGNALLWLISCSESGRKFADWTSLKTALDESFGPLGADEDNRLQLFSLTQNGPLDEYIREFSRLSLMVSGLDDQSRALLFVRGLSASLRYEAMREHPRTVSEALRAARMAHRQVSLTRGNDQRQNREGTGYRRPSGRNVNEAIDHPFTTRRTKLSESDRAKLLREGRCFKCRQTGHMAKDCPEVSPNAVRQ